MTGSVLLLGGYGNFGKRIAAALIRHQVPVIIVGRDAGKAQALVGKLDSPLASCASFDVQRELPQYLETLKPVVVVNTCGPFQARDYDAAKACVDAGVHYIDLADGRDFVAGFTALDQAAQARGVTLITGASTVPGLSSAVIEEYKSEFSTIDGLVYGIAPGQRSERGLATAQAILTYVGRKLRPFAGATKKSVYGWQDLYQQPYPVIGKRWMANCDVPDLDLLPARYGISRIRFSAGLELGFMHLTLWALSWLVRLTGINILPLAPLMLKLSDKFDALGTADGGMHVILTGRDTDGKPHRRRWFIIARDGSGPQIPCVPSIVLARRLAQGEVLKTGAYPCVGLVSLQDYLAELQHFNIRAYDRLSE